MECGQSGRIPKDPRGILHGSEREGDHPGEVPLHRRAVGLFPGGGVLGALQRGPLVRRLPQGARGRGCTLALEHGHEHPAGRRLTGTSSRRAPRICAAPSTRNWITTSPISTRPTPSRPRASSCRPSRRSAAPRSTAKEGDDHEPASAEVKKAGLTLVPPVWASVMGEGTLPAQPWDGWQLLENNRLNELVCGLPLSRDQPGCGIYPQLCTLTEK